MFFQQNQTILLTVIKKNYIMKLTGGSNAMEFSFFDKRNWNSWFRVTYYATNTWKNFELGYSHSHDRLELLYVYYGELTLQYCVDGQWKELTLYSNDYILIDVNILHTIRSGPCISQVFALEIRLIPEATSELQYNLRHLILCDPALNAFFSQDQKVVRLSDSGHLVSIIRELQQCLETAQHQGTYFDLLVSLLFAAIGNDYCSQRYPHRTGIRHLRKATEYIASNFHREISCREISEHAGVSLNYLNKLFSEQFDMTINTYINHLRIQEARRLIERTDIPLTEIYRQVGYKTNQNFSKQFIKQIGLAPSAYRRQLKDAQSEKNFEKNSNFVSELPE